MILATTDSIEGRRIARVLGVARGNTIRAKHIGYDIQAYIRNLTGGEVKEYTKLLSESREQAIDRMIIDAERMGANAIVGVRITTAMIMMGAAEIMVYGTAVILEDD
jgi:uncharacterized protein YbjQ (UPF0145 family)